MEAKPTGQAVPATTAAARCTRRTRTVIAAPVEGGGIPSYVALSITTCSRSDYAILLATIDRRVVVEITTLFPL
jgi:hypothetical protein